MDGTGPIGTLIMMMMRAAIRRILLPFLARRRVGFCSTSVPQACSTGPDSQPQGSEQIMNIMNKNEFFLSIISCFSSGHLLEELTSIEFEARFKVRSCEFLGKVFGLTEAIRLLLRFRTVSFGSRRSCTRLRRRWR